jgi:hypothetical protein
VNGLNDTAHSIEQIEWLEQLEAAATLPGSEQRWEDELWARQELSDSPITTAAHEFNCTVAARAMLAMYHTKSDLFAVAEVELLGYNRENESLCALECRHGGSCLSTAEAGCSCPTEAWGWAVSRHDYRCHLGCILLNGSGIVADRGRAAGCATGARTRPRTTRCAEACIRTVF